MKEIPEDEYLSSDDFKKAVKEKLKERFFGLEPTEPEIKLSVGQEFVNWAEKYWGLKIKYEVTTDEVSESCQYDYVKNIFIQKIDEIIKNRL